MTHIAAEKTVLSEIVILFFVCVLYGAWMVPDVNEVYYVSKAIHFWQPGWIPDDEFLGGRDSHWTFYALFGWLSFFVSPAATAWCGRCISWILLAWSWQRLSYTLIPLRYASVLTGLALAYYINNFHEAGEWIIGGVEGKTLAYPFVFFAVTEMLLCRWNRCFLFLGTASAFHILAGGWAFLIIAVLFIVQSVKRKNEKGSGLVKWLPLTFYFLPCAFGLIPALLLDCGTSSETIRQAHQIYCYDRLQHHLVPYLFPLHFRCRFALLTLIWICFCRFASSGNDRQRLFDGFIWGTLILAGIGYAAAYCLSGSREWSAEVLRFYWFRTADIAVPMGVAAGCVSAIHNKKTGQSGWIVSLALLILPLTAVVPQLEVRCKQTYPRTEPVGISGAVVAPDWYDLCRWIKTNTAKDVRFWIPRDATTFKWYAQRSDTGVWKDIPQDAAGVVRWRKAMNDLFTYKNANGVLCTDRLLTTLLAEKTPEELLLLKKEYGFHYVVCLNIPTTLPAVTPESLPVNPHPALLEPVYSNGTYTLYRFKH
ncbi:MAG: hypothetical protein LBT46_14035 [Planctomycetaceae bacterium]|jgi:hypothetical protein|nr:hypothetical protein [Planctomycetaceae bacterium]